MVIKFLVVIDGVRVSDPSSIASGYDLRLLSTDNIESIEIIKGALSTLYGTNAATAVINITSKKESEKKIAGIFKTSVGTNQTAEDQNYNASSFDNSAQVSGTLNRLSYSAGFSNSYADGLSAVVTETNEEDPFSRFATDIKLGYRITDSLQVRLSGNQTKFRTEFDESSGGLEADYLFISEQERIALNSSYTYKNGSLQLNAAYSLYDGENISNFPSTFTGDNFIVDFYNKYNLGDTWYTVLGLNYSQDAAVLEADEKFSIIDPYVNVVYVSKFGLNINAGLRLNNHSEYGNTLVYTINPSYRLNVRRGYLKFLSSYATSYITPNLIQLFGQFGANPNLAPEEGRTLEAGVEYAVSQQLRFSGLYFNRSEDNAIQFVDNQLLNAPSNIKAQGVEVELNWLPTDVLQFSANYTYTERKGDAAVRIPKHKVNSTLYYTPVFGTNLSLSYQYTDARPDFEFLPTDPFVVVRNLEAFSLLNFQASQVLIPQRLTVFFYVDNLLNEAFTEVVNFTTRGRNLRAGLRLNL